MSERGLTVCLCRHTEKKKAPRQLCRSRGCSVKRETTSRSCCRRWCSRTMRRACLPLLLQLSTHSQRYVCPVWRVCPVISCGFGAFLFHALPFFFVCLRIPE